jgi:archaeal type IV pilus assembly protein PilA
MNFKRLMKNNKGISPIFATLILIAIAVIAGVVVYMFTSGTLATMTGGGTAAQEKVAIQAVQGTHDTALAAGSVKVYAQSLSGGEVKLDSVILKNAAGTVVAPLTGITYTVGSTTGIATSLTTVTIVVPAATGMAQGSSYTVTLVSSAGGNFVSQSFVVS